MDRSAGASPRTLRSSASLPDHDVTRQVAAALVVDFARFKATHKVIAEKAGASPKTAENWTAGISAPSLAMFLRLLPHSPSLQGMVRRVMGMEADMDPDFQRELIELLRRHGR